MLTNSQAKPSGVILAKDFEGTGFEHHFVCTAPKGIAQKVHMTDIYLTRDEAIVKMVLPANRGYSKHEFYLRYEKKYLPKERLDKNPNVKLVEEEEKNDVQPDQE